MKNQIKKILIFSFFLFMISAGHAFGADRYWVGGTGNWSDDDNHWSTSSGGSPADGNVPSASDNCIFDQSSSTANAAYTVTVNASATCLDFTMDGPHASDTNKVTWAGSSALAISGSMNLSGTSTGITRTYTGAITFNATTTGKTAAWGGVTMGNTINFSGVGGKWTLQDALNNGSSTIDIVAGTFNDGGYAVTCGTFRLNTGAASKVLQLSGITTVSGWNAITTGAGLTLTMSGTLVFTATAIGVSGSHAYNVLRLTNSGSVAINNIVGSTSFASIELPTNNTSVTAGTITFTSGGAGLVTTGTGLTWTGGFSKSSGTVSISNTRLVSSAASGAATWLAYVSNTNSDGGSNSGWVFAPSKYWVGGSGNTSDTAHWSATSGGAGSAGVPTGNDACIFNSASASADYTVTLDSTFDCYSVTTTAPSSGNLAFAGSSTWNVYGTFTLYSGITSTIPGVTFKSVSTGKTITMAGKSWASAVTFNGVGGGWTLQDAWDSGSSDVTLTAGTLNTNGQTVTVGSFIISGSTTRTLTLGASVLTLGSAGTAWDSTTTTGLTLNANTSTIKFTNSSASSKTFAGGGGTYYNLEVATGNTGATIITGSNTFNKIYINGNDRILHFTAATTTTFTSGGDGITTNGTGLTITSATSATHTLTKSSGTVSVSNTTISYSTAGGGASWLASTGSGNVDGGNNSGWDFSVTIDISGTTDAGDGVTVSVAVNDTLQGQTTTTSSGAWTITGVVVLGAGDIITVYLDGTVAESAESTAVTKWSSGNITGMVLNTNVLTIGSNQNTSVSTTNLTQYENSDDENVMHSSSSTGVLVVDAGSVYSGETLSILASNTLTVASASYESVTTESLTNAGTITATGGPLFTIAGLSFTNTGTFTAGTSTIKLTDASASAKTFAGGGATYYNLYITGAGTGDYTITGSNTFNQIKDDGSAAHSIKFTAGTTQTITSLYIHGSNGNLITLKSTSDGSTWTLSDSSGTNIVQYVSLRDSIATGGALFVGINSTSVSGNSGWVFAIYSAGANLESSGTPVGVVTGGSRGGGSNLESSGTPAGTVTGGSQGGGAGNVG